MAGEAFTPQDGCVFCAIVAGDAPAQRIYEDDLTVGFLDIFPLTAGHALVVPRRHSPDLLTAPASDVAAVALSAQRVAAAAVAPDGLRADGFNLIQANGAIAFQTVFHLHVHVLPRYRGDGFTLPFERRPGDAGQLADLAGR